ncbi:circularly permuted type 2 ATP-grasp protein [Thalassococcus sp. BH17M4-6]|uniref:circularly permuted type 2 ATP-grasp protein n=1 Tax=Thalassococcus sp. BH17M4-6 TaxID=3413148 RepID=UPI003BC96AA7
MDWPDSMEHDPAAALIAHYSVPAGVADEMIGPGGQVRAVWKPFLDRFARLSDEDLARRFARGDRYLRDAGVFFRQYREDGPTERDWPLSHVPVLLHEGEWQQISAALRQRADLLERVVADLYGPGDLVRSGHLPPELVAGNPAWLRPMVGVAPPSGHYLHFLAFELGRNPDGSWFVLGDRTEAPSGAGFALENRVATTRTFSDPFPQGHIHRLSGFFRAFRDAMQAAARGNDGRLGILTSGLGTETYFEHAYIARYLGLMLLEGEDLTVENGRTMVRTVAGLKPLSVLWRRMDASFADPLELDDGSQIGTPGLAASIRGGHLSMLNALGTGVLQTRALLAFLPRIARHLQGQPLAMSNIATWWCGQDKERQYVRQNAGRMMLANAYSQDLPFEVGPDTVIAGRFQDGRAQDLSQWIDQQARHLVGQEAVSLSTTPVFHNGALVPRPVMLRVFAARTDQGWTLMPGGYARIGRSGDATALALRKGGSVADVWIVSDDPVPADSLVAKDGPFQRATPSLLPARAADNLFWLGRYVERAEGLIRLVRASHMRLAETGDLRDARVRRIGAFLERSGVPLDQPVPQAIPDQVMYAIRCASKVRDRFSIDGWTALRALQDDIADRRSRVSHGDEAARALGQMLRGTAAFSGLVHDNMYRFSGWRFLSLGRALERAQSMAYVLGDFCAPDAPEGGFDIAIELGDSVMAHRRRYLIETNRNTVIDLLALDHRNPRSIRFQVSFMRRLVSELPEAEVNGTLSPLSAAILRIETRLATAEPARMDAGRLQALSRSLTQLSDTLTNSYLT